MPEILSIEFEAPSGDDLRFDWEFEQLRSFDPEVADPPPWRLSGDLDWDEVDRLRVLTARFEEGPMLAIAAILPAGAPGHGEEAIAALRIAADGEPEQLDQVLFSSEHAEDGALGRIGLELYRHDSGLPLRVAGEPTAAASHVDGRVVHRHHALTLRGPDGAGTGALDVLETE